MILSIGIFFDNLFTFSISTLTFFQSIFLVDSNVVFKAIIYLSTIHLSCLLVDVIDIEVLGSVVLWLSVFFVLIHVYRRVFLSIFFKTYQLYF